MIVRMEIEFDMRNTNPEAIKGISNDQILDALKIQNSNLNKGVEISTERLNNAFVDFYVLPYSATILSSESMDFTEDMLDVEDLEVNDDLNGVNSQIALYLDPDRKFGTNINDDDSAWVNCYVNYCPEQNKVDFDIYISREDSYEDVEYSPTDEEKELVKSLMEKYCQKNNNCSITELLQSYQNQELSGGMTL